MSGSPTASRSGSSRPPASRSSAGRPPASRSSAGRRAPRGLAVLLSASRRRARRGSGGSGSSPSDEEIFGRPGAPLVAPVLWITWAAVVGVGLAGPGPVWVRLVSIAVSSVVLCGVGHLARRAAADLAFRPGRKAAGLVSAGDPTLSPRSPETRWIESRLHISLHSRSYFERILAPYLGSLVVGRPLGDLDLWSTRRESPAVREARAAFEQVIGVALPVAPSPRRVPHPILQRLFGPKPPTAAELEDLVEKVEQAHERNRRRGSVPQHH